MASAWDQLEQQRQDHARLKRAQLAETVGDSLFNKHLSSLPATRLVQLAGPSLTALTGSAAASAPGIRPDSRAVRESRRLRSLSTNHPTSRPHCGTNGSSQRRDTDRAGTRRDSADAARNDGPVRRRHHARGARRPSTHGRP